MIAIQIYCILQNLCEKVFADPAIMFVLLPLTEELQKAPTINVMGSTVFLKKKIVFVLW